MRLTGVKEGDIVRVAGSYALVVGKPGRGKLSVNWLGRNGDVGRPVRANEVEQHWRKAKS